MLTIALWLLTAVVAGGIALACLWLLERPFGGAGRAAAIAHGAGGAAGTLIVLTLLVRGAPDPAGLGRVAAAFLGAALLGGAVVVVAQWRRRRPPGLIVALHATVGIAGFVILLGYASVTH